MVLARNVSILIIFVLLSQSGFVQVQPSSEKSIPWFDGSIYLDANWSMLSLGCEIHHTCFGLICNKFNNNNNAFI